MRTFLLSTAIGMMIASTAVALEFGGAPSPGTCKEVQTCGAPDCCANCGARTSCEKSCRIVCEMKEVKKTVWVVKCSEFCTMLPGCDRECEEDGCSTCGKEGCGVVASCEGCGQKSCNPCAVLEAKKYVTPDCGKIRDKKTLEKKEVICKVPTYKCVVTYGCGGCGSQGSGGKIEQQAPAAAPTTTPAPPPKTTQLAPLPPVVGTAFLSFQKTK
jgi:hypothetical protein